MTPFALRLASRWPSSQLALSAHCLPNIAYNWSVNSSHPPFGKVTEHHMQRYTTYNPAERKISTLWAPS